jgi:hypothetical protein
VQCDEHVILQQLLSGSLIDGKVFFFQRSGCHFALPVCIEFDRSQSPRSGTAPGAMAAGRKINRMEMHTVTADVSTEGADRKFLIWDVSKEFPISLSVLHRFS